MKVELTIFTPYAAILKGALEDFKGKFDHTDLLQYGDFKVLANGGDYGEYKDAWLKLQLETESVENYTRALHIIFYEFASIAFDLYNAIDGAHDIDVKVIEL